MFRKKDLLSIFLILLLVLFIGCGKKNKFLNQSNDNYEEKSNANQTSFNELRDNDNVISEKNYDIIFIELGSVNCVPCRAMQPIMKEIEEEYAGIVKVVFHDVWTEKGYKNAELYSIRVIPTQVFLDKNENEFFRHEGFFAKEELVKIIEEKLENKPY